MIEVKIFFACARFIGFVRQAKKLKRKAWAAVELCCTAQSPNWHLLILKTCSKSYLQALHQCYFCIVKRILVLAILICYSIASFGVSVNYFYCCGKLKTVSLVDKSTEQNCKGKKKKACCNNKKVRIQLKEDQQQNTANTNYEIVAPFAFAILPEHDFFISNHVVEKKQPVLYKRPPPNLFPSRNILFCVFRI